MSLHPKAEELLTVDSFWSSQSQFSFKDVVVVPVDVCTPLSIWAARICHGGCAGWFYINLTQAIASERWEPQLRKDLHKKWL